MKLKVMATGVIAAVAGLASAGVANASTLQTHSQPTKAKTAVKTFKTSVHPDSASGCNQQTCIYVFGNGAHVSYWSATGETTRADRCTQAAAWIGGTVAYYGSLYCSTNSYYYSTLLSNYTFTGKGNLQLCNTWVNGPKGKPCETVKRGG